jgi:1,4-dihydroxy-2-naphthoyl-CoA hydrolase
MFKHQPSLESLNKMNDNTLAKALQISFVELGQDYLVAKMPVNANTKQPAGLLHGGASVALAETLGSVAGFLCLDDPTKQSIVGVEINANHIRSAKDGFVFGKTTAIHLGRTTQVWETKITNEEGKLICISRLTVAVINQK